MGKDTGWKGFLSDDARYADVINGVGCNGKQVVKKEDLQEMDTQTGMFRGSKFIHRFSQLGKGNVKVRDCLRKVAFGTNFAIIGIENQDTMDYSIPLRNMSYDVDAYERQATKIRKETRKKHKGLSAGEYLYGFKKDDKLLPAVTFILYSGSKSWDGPKTLHEILDFTDIPERLKEMVAADDYYKNMEEDAFDVVVQYTNATELIEAKEYYEKDGEVDMCKALTDLIESGRAEGKEIGKDEKLREQVEKKVKKGLSIPEIADALEEKAKDIEKIVAELQMK